MLFGEILRKHWQNLQNFCNHVTCISGLMIIKMRFIWCFIATLCCLVFGFWFLVFRLTYTDKHNENIIISDFYTRTSDLSFEGRRCNNQIKIIQPETLHETYDEAVIRTHPNLPYFTLTASKLSSLIPDIVSIRWTGNVFQESWRHDPKFLLYSAHFDAREKKGVVVRIIALYNGETKPNESYSCQMWFNSIDNPVMSSITDLHIVDDIVAFSPHHLNPYILSCDAHFNITSNHPIAVSLVKTPCMKPSNLLQIGGSPTGKSRKVESMNRQNIPIAICGKALFYYNQDFSHRLIEWIEIMKALGAAKIFLYRTNSHKNVEKVLDYYESKGTVKIITFHYPPPYEDEGTFRRLWTKTKKVEYRAAQKIYLNDCLLRNKDNYDYLGHFDADEIPVLGKHTTFNDFLKYIRKM